MDTSLVFAVVAGIIIIGFAGEFFFKKTGIPIFIFLILTGIILGPILNLFPRASLISVLAPFAELTLLMVLFYGGLGLKSTVVLANGGRALIQAIIYVGLSSILIGSIGIFIMNWGILPSFIFASMISGETTAALLVPLSRWMKMSEAASSFLKMEADHKLYSSHRAFLHFCRNLHDPWNQFVRSFFRRRFTVFHWNSAGRHLESGMDLRALSSSKAEIHVRSHSGANPNHIFLDHSARGQWHACRACLRHCLWKLLPRE